MIKGYFVRRRQNKINTQVRKFLDSASGSMKELSTQFDVFKTVIDDMASVIKTFQDKFKQTPQPPYLKVHQGLKSWK